MNKAQVHKGRRSEAIRGVFWGQREKDFADIGDISKIFISDTRSYVNPSDLAMNLSGAATCVKSLRRRRDFFLHFFGL